MTQSRVGRWSTRAAAGMLAVALGAAGMTGVAQAAPQALNDVSIAWTLNDESGGGAYFGGCNFLSAGTAGDTGSSRVWTESDGFYASQSGNVRVEKPTSADGWEQPTWATKCKNAAGTAVSTSVGSTTGNRVVLEHGTGTIDQAAKTATINWTGSFTVVFYGGLTYWTASNPVLTVNADGTGTLTATASGYGASMEDPEKWEQLAPAQIHLADLSNVQLGAQGFTVTPDYLGVTLSGDVQSEKTAVNEAYWGSFPQSFVDFQNLTGQSSYWYSSGGAADQKKTTKALTVSYATVAPTPVAKVTLSGATSKAYGAASTVTAAVTATAGAAVSGTVTFKEGTRTLGAASVAGGKSTVTLAGTTLAVGTHSVVAVYSGNAGLTAATSPALKLTVSKATSAVTAKIAKKKIKAKKKSKVTVTVKAAGVTPAGKATVTWKGTNGKAKGKKVTKTVTLKKGKASATSAKLSKKGTYKVTVVYAGSATVKSASKSAGKLVVK